MMTIAIKREWTAGISPLVRFGVAALGLSLLFAAAPCVWGQNHAPRSTQPGCGTFHGPGSHHQGGQPAFRDHRDSCGNSWGSLYGRWQSYTSFSNFGTAMWRADRRARYHDDLEERREETRIKKSEAREERRNAYRPPPPQSAPIHVDWGEPPTLEQTAERMIAANQANARSSAMTEVPKGVRDMTPVGVDDCTYYYKDGEFFFPDPDGNAVNVEAPLGAMVFAIPAESERIQSGGLTYFAYKSAYFRRIPRAGQLIYEVVNPPSENQQ